MARRLCHRHVAGYGCIVLEFAFPWALLALPLPLLAWWLLPPHRQKVSALRVPFFDMVVSAAGTEARSGAVVMRRRIFQMLVAALVWTAIVVGLAKPEWVGEPIVRTEAARDIMLAIDLSGSMDYRDFPDADGNNVSRFTGRAARCQTVRRGSGERSYRPHRIRRPGLPAVAVHARSRRRPGSSRGADGSRYGRTEDCNLGDAIGLSIRAFESSEVDDRVLILLTDGNDTASKMTPLNAAGIAELNGVEIHTIGIGDINATGEDRVDFAALEDDRRTNRRPVLQCPGRGQSLPRSIALSTRRRRQMCVRSHGGPASRSCTGLPVSQPFSYCSPIALLLLRTRPEESGYGMSGIDLFHFLRPLWLLATTLVDRPCVVDSSTPRNGRQPRSGNFVAPHLRDALTVNRSDRN